MTAPDGSLAGGAGAGEHGVEHRLGQPAGERVLLADVVGREQLPRTERELRAVREPRPGPGRRVTELGGGDQDAVPREAAERDDRADLAQRRELARQVADAAIALDRRWLVPGRREVS